MYIYLYLHVSHLNKILCTKCPVIPGVLAIIIITMQWHPVSFSQSSPVRCLKAVDFIWCLPILAHLFVVLQVPADHGSNNSPV